LPLTVLTPIIYLSLGIVTINPYITSKYFLTELSVLDHSKLNPYNWHIYFLILYFVLHLLKLINNYAIFLDLLHITFILIVTSNQSLNNLLHILIKLTIS